MKCPTIHLLKDGKPLCGTKKGFGTNDLKEFKKTLQPCGKCQQIYSSKKLNKPITQ